MLNEIALRALHELKDYCIDRAADNKSLEQAYRDVTRYIDRLIQGRGYITD